MQSKNPRLFRSDFNFLNQSKNPRLFRSDFNFLNFVIMKADASKL